MKKETEPPAYSWVEDKVLTIVLPKASLRKIFKGTALMIRLTEPAEVAHINVCYADKEREAKLKEMVE